jgi:hypothetical protein
MSLSTVLKTASVTPKNITSRKLFSSTAQQPLVGPGPPHYRGFTITLRHTPHSVGLLWTSDQPTQRPLSDNTQHSHETDIHAPGGIRTNNPSKRAAADPRLRPRGHWDRQNTITLSHYFTKNKKRYVRRKLFEFTLKNLPSVDVWFSR